MRGERANVRARMTTVGCRSHHKHLVTGVWERTNGTSREGRDTGGSAARGGQTVFGARAGTSCRRGPRQGRNMQTRAGRRSERESEPATICKERSYPDGGGRNGKRQGLVSPRRERTCRGGMLRPRSSARSWLRGRCSLSSSSRSHRAWSAGGAEAPAVRVFHSELHVAQNPIGFPARGSQVERTIKSRRRGVGRDGPERMQRMELISCPGGILELFGLSSTPSPPSQRQTQ